MARAYDIVTFDCYGTLIDWESGIAGAFLRAAAEDGIPIDRETALRAYADAERAIERGSYRSYREVLTAAASSAARSLGWARDYARCGFLALSLPHWQPFPDTNAALEKLVAAGYRLGILSNVDDDLLAATRRHFTVGFDLIITAQQVHSYKPAHGHFLSARQWLGDGPRWLHAAQSNFHDIVPTNTLGIPNAWINRKGEAPLPGGTPTHQFANLTELAAAIV